MKNLGTINANTSYNFLIEHGVKDGTFKDIEIGDYVKIIHENLTTQSSPYNTTCTKWWIAGLDWKYKSERPTTMGGMGIKGGPSSTVHHILLIPERPLAQGKYNNNGSIREFTVTDIFYTILRLSMNLANALSGTILQIGDNYLASNGSSSGYSMAGNNMQGYTSKLELYYTSYLYAMIPTELELRGAIGASSGYLDNRDSTGIIPLFNILPFTYWIKNPAGEFHGNEYAIGTRSRMSNDYYVGIRGSGELVQLSGSATAEILPYIFLGV